MAVYFQGNPPEIQVPDGLQTLVLMNPNYVHQYSDTPTPQTTNNLVFLNSNSNSNSAHALHSPHSQQLVGIPLSAAATPAAQESLHGLLHRVHYNLYNPIDPSAGARDTPRAQQGLSLTLSSQQQQQPNSNYGPAAASQDIRVSAGWGSSGSGVTNGASSSGMHGVLLSSKYLKAAQELLDEVVNVNNMMSNKGADQLHRNGSGNNNSSSSKAIGESSSAGEAAGKRSVELSTAERQEIQMKKAKLINMLDEVEQRYKQYHEQMQMVIATFEQAAGIGTARTYTALALKTISRQFRCLKDAITGQIRACSKSLGEEDSKIIEGSRLKFVDNHFRQQRALQHLGMIQHNAWRPQRGLPERSVSVLRAWLFEHFLHPYPKDSDKQMLAKQTGLTRSQVSNWFINARVRLWKPMVEEMYLEEIKEQEQSGASENKVTRKCPPKNEDTSFSPTHETKAKQDMNQNHQINETAATTNIAGDQPGFSLMDMEGMAPASPKRLRSSGCNEMMLQSPGAGSCMSSINMDKQQRVGRDEYSFMGTHTDFMGSFGQYPIDIGGGGGGRFDETEHHHHHQQQQQQFTTPRFSGNNGVSLTLGLPHCDNLSLSGAHHHHHHHQGFLQNPNTVQIMGRQMNHDQFGAAAMSASTNTAAFENIQNGKRFAAHLLHDFVA